MKRSNWKLETTLIAVTLLGTVAPFAMAVRVASAEPAYGQDRRWDEPPSEFDEVSRRGFHDGLEGARKDYQNHRRPDVNNREEFRHPHVPDRDREAYRRGFERGYQVAVDHHDHGRY